MAIKSSSFRYMIYESKGTIEKEKLLLNIYLKLLRRHMYRLYKDRYNSVRIILSLSKWVRAIGGGDCDGGGGDGGGSAGCRLECNNSRCVYLSVYLSECVCKKSSERKYTRCCLRKSRHVCMFSSEWNFIWPFCFILKQKTKTKKIKTNKNWMRLNNISSSRETRKSVFN